MTVTIQLRRGNQATLPTLADGEAAFTLDTHRLFMGQGGSRYEIGSRISEAYWVYNTSTTMADPGSGKVRANNASGPVVTTIALSRYTEMGIDFANVLRSLLADDALYIQDKTDVANWLRYRITAPATDNSTWFSIPVVNVGNGGSSPGNNSRFLLSFGTGTSGGSGGLPPFNSLTDADWALDDRLPLYDTSAAANRDGQVSHLLGMARTAPGGRLTITSGVPVTSADVSGIVYYTPYEHDVIMLWDGTRWVVLRFTEASITLPSTNNLNYDIWGYLSGTALALESSVWTGDTSRNAAVAPTYQDGRLCKTGDKTRLYLGTVRVGAGAVLDTVAQRFVWNMYNRVQRRLVKLESAASWVYTTVASRPLNNSTANRVEAVYGLAGVMTWITGQILTQGTTTGTRTMRVGYDSTTVSAPGILLGGATETGYFLTSFQWLETPAVGYHYFQALEVGAGSGTTTWYGGDQYGITGYTVG